MNIQKSFQNKTGVTGVTGILYIVATPIGNLADTSFRAVEILSQVDLIAAEDTRHTQKLLQHFKFKTPLISYHRFNEKMRQKELLDHLQAGKSLALVSDAGMPGIADPGEQLVQYAIHHQIPVVPIPGPNAALSALVASGLPTGEFCFIGFLPRKTTDRKKKLAQWADIPATLLCYESPHRLLPMLKDCLEVLQDRKVAIARELTKRNEEWMRGELSECITAIHDRGVRGEYTIVIEGAGKEPKQESWWQELTLMEHIQKYLAQGYSSKEAIVRVAKDRDCAKREVYNYFHQNK